MFADIGMTHQITYNLYTIKLSDTDITYIQQNMFSLTLTLLHKTIEIVLYIIEILYIARKQTKTGEFFQANITWTYKDSSRILSDK